MYFLSIPLREKEKGFFTLLFFYSQITIYSHDFWGQILPERKKMMHEWSDYLDAATSDGNTN